MVKKKPKNCFLFFLSSFIHRLFLPPLSLSQSFIVQGPYVARV